jgi:ATP-independent RNA helicase DbpA
MIDQILERFSIAQLNPMQEAALKAIQPGKDVVLLSPTGSGKTLGFLLPLLKMLDDKQSGVQAMVVAPSRELAVQIGEVFKKMQTGFKVITTYGGHAMRIERNNLTEPPALIVGTPGRIADHLKRNTFDPTGIGVLVLDEFDKSLELGFATEMKYIVAQLNNLKTRVLTSATTLDEIPGFIGVHQPDRLDFTVSAPPLRLNFAALRALDQDKIQLLFHLLCTLGNEPSLIFCNHRDAVERISELLSSMGIVHGMYHGGLDQDQRELALIRFRNGTHHILITTDLASRGLDVPEIMHIIHYQLPATASVFTHRNGRTARMHASGAAWLLLAANDFVPEFIETPPVFVELAEAGELPQPTPWETVYLSLGKKDKVSKGDVAGFLMQKGQLPTDALGKIEVLDHRTFAAIKRPLCEKMLRKIKGQPLKKKSVRVELAG